METEIYTITATAEEKEAVEAFCNSVGLSVDDVFTAFMKNIVRYKEELLSRFRQGENAKVLVTEIIDRTISELTREFQ